MVGTSRCNSMSGAYEVRPPAVAFPGPVIITVVGCVGDHPSNAWAVEVAERVLFADPSGLGRASDEGGAAEGMSLPVEVSNAACAASKRWAET